MPEKTVTGPTDLPTIAEIEAATDVLSMPDNSAKVVRVREHFAVKFGNGIPLGGAKYEVLGGQQSSASAQGLRSEEMNRGILERLRRTEESEYVGFLQTMVDTTLHGHRTVFTHGDLQPKNIMVQDVESHKGGSSQFEVTIIDWEISGWYPE
ncbi:hypothetical protein APSETT444_005175 [Aspergillus pseudonomiae]